MQQNPTLATSLSNTIARFSTGPHPTDNSAPSIPVELTTGFRLLGHPVGSSDFAATFFSARITDIKECITSLNTSIDDQQTKLKLFSQYIIQKIPHLLASDILYNLPTNHPDQPWKEWHGPLTSATEEIIKNFLATLLNNPSIPDFALLISQLGLKTGGLGILCPRTRAAPDFVITMRSTIRNAQHRFQLHKDLLPFQLHQSLGDLFTISTKPDSLILQWFHCLLPQIANIACAPTIPTPNRIQPFLSSVSPHSA
jgi:hypothetical protein